MKILLPMLLVMTLVAAGCEVKNTPTKVEVTFDKQKIDQASDKLDQAAETAVESGKEAVRKTGKALERAGEKMQEFDGQPTTATPAQPATPDPSGDVQ